MTPQTLGILGTVAMCSMLIGSYYRFSPQPHLTITASGPRHDVLQSSKPVSDFFGIVPP
jgi:hypothetical protein